jgi:hypothetical protein
MLRGAAGYRPGARSSWSRRWRITLRHFPHWASDTTDAQDLATLVRLTVTGRLHLEIGATADWTETTAVLEDLYQRRIRGNAVLTIPSRHRAQPTPGNEPGLL